MDSAAIAAAKEVCWLHAKGLFLASYFLPPAKRRAVYAVFAFAWLIDQAINDSSCTDDSIQDRLDLFRDRLEEIYTGRLELPASDFRDQTQHILSAFAETAAGFEIPKQYFIDWAEGFRMDRTVRRYATWASLQKFCYHAGGVEALAMTCVLGVQNSDASKYAVSLGTAIRFTRMLANLKSDWERGRVYLPLEDLARFGYTERELAGGVVNPTFCELMKFEITRARELYRAGAEGICWLSEDGSRAAVAVITVNSAAILRDIERAGYEVFRKPFARGTAKTLLLLPAAWRLARRNADQPLPPL